MTVSLRPGPAPSALALAASGNATTLCRCWRVERRDGTVLGFTDHDEPLLFGGVPYAAATGIDGALADASMGLSVEDAEIAGALSHDGLEEDDLARGLYDGAEVALFVVDWTRPEVRARLSTYVVGEVVRAGGAFRAELCGLTQLLERATARRFRRECDAELGDARCGVDLGVAGRTLDTTVAALDGDRLVLADAPPDAHLPDTHLPDTHPPDTHPPDAFAHGRIEWLSGANAGGGSRIAGADAADGALALRPWRAPDRPVAPGDRLRVVAGCDKSLATCRARFGNAANHRGFPHLPGNDFAFSYAYDDAVHDGRPVVT